MTAVRVAILGVCGWMGKCHSLGYRNMGLLYPKDGITAEIRWIVDETGGELEAMRAHFPGAKVSTRWQDAVDDPEVDLVDICLPDRLHYVVAKSALEQGKHVYCEKPLTDTVAQARELAELAAKTGRITRIGHNYPRNPAHELAKEILDNGEIGDLVLFRASMHVDVVADPDTPYIWRCDGKLAPTGIVGDTASHIFSFIDYFFGEVESLVADVATVTRFRPVLEGFTYGARATAPAGAPMREVTNADLVTLLCRFKHGGRGIIDVSRVATGHKFMQNYEITGTRGAIAYDYNALSSLRVFSSTDAPGREGFRTIEVGPERQHFAALLPLANLGIGYNEIKAIEACDAVRSAATGKPAWPDFQSGLRIMKVIDACFRSSAEGTWVKV